MFRIQKKGAGNALMHKNKTMFHTCTFETHWFFEIFGYGLNFQNIKKSRSINEQSKRTYDKNVEDGVYDKNHIKLFGYQIKISKPL